MVVLFIVLNVGRKKMDNFSIGSEIMFSGNPVVVAWFKGSMSFLIFFIISCGIGFGLWLWFGNQRAGAI